eukprot:jgi/Botrbrau1/5582/Bobra.97_2s0013.1
MGNCCGTPEKEPPRPATPTPAPARKEETPSQPARPAEPVPDPALQSTLKAVKSLGRGGTGDTWLYIDRATGDELAVKLMKRPLPRVIQPNIEREIRIQADLGEGHVNIINAKEAVLTENHLCLVLEYAEKGSLTGYVADRWQHGQKYGLFLTEDEARYFFRQFLAAVEYCHSHSVAHRDLKLDNTLLSGDDPPIVKLCDFGFAKDWETVADMHTHIGTPVYMSPELITSNGKSYDGRGVDVWASGVLLIVMLLGQFPYDHIENPDPNSKDAQEEVWKQQLTQYRELPSMKPLIRKLSPEVLDLLDKIFVISASERIQLSGIKDHPWFKKPLPEKFAAAEKRIIEEQERLEERTKNRAINADKLKARNQDIAAMLTEATRRAKVAGAPSTAPLSRIDLREGAILETAAAGETGLADVAEE